MLTLKSLILISDMKMSSSFLAFLQINNCLSETKILVIDSVNNDVESKIDFGTAKPSHKKSLNNIVHTCLQEIYIFSQWTVHRETINETLSSKYVKT